MPSTCVQAVCKPAVPASKAVRFWNAVSKAPALQPGWPAGASAAARACRQCGIFSGLACFPQDEEEKQWRPIPAKIQPCQGKQYLHRCCCSCSMWCLSAESRLIFTLIKAALKENFCFCFHFVKQMFLARFHQQPSCLDFFLRYFSHLFQNSFFITLTCSCISGRIKWLIRITKWFSYCVTVAIWKLVFPWV